MGCVREGDLPPFLPPSPPPFLPSGLLPFLLTLSLRPCTTLHCRPSFPLPPFPLPPFPSTHYLPPFPSLPPLPFSPSPSLAFASLHSTADTFRSPAPSSPTSFVWVPYLTHASVPPQYPYPYLVSLPSCPFPPTLPRITRPIPPSHLPPSSPLTQAMWSGITAAQLTPLSTSHVPFHSIPPLG